MQPRTAPNMPGFSIPESSKKASFHKKHMLDYRNGYQVARSIDQTKEKFALTNVSKTMDDIAKKMQYGEWATKPRQKPMTVKEWYASLPPPEKPVVSKYEGVVLTFDAYIKDVVSEDLRGPAIGVLDQQSNTFSVRRIVIRYFLEDDSIEIREPAVLNSGLTSGPLLKRQQAKSSPYAKENIRIHDFQIGKDLVVFGQHYHIVSADLFTKKYCEKEFGIIFPNGQESMPSDPYVKAREATKKTIIESHRKAADDAWLKEKYRRFVSDDRKVLRFFCVWEDNGEQKKYELNYYLVDDTVEVIDGSHGKAKLRDQPSIMLRRQILPKQVKGIHDLAGTTPLGTEIDSKPPSASNFYKWTDFSVGDYVNVLNRPFLIIGVDGFTKNFLTSNGVKAEDLEPLSLESENNKSDGPVRIKDEQRVHQRNFQNMIKYEGMSFTFTASLIANSHYDSTRKFVVSFKLGEELISVFEPAEKANIGGGKIADRALAINPQTNDYYRAQDFHVGAVIKVHGRVYKLEDADEFTYNFMAKNKFAFANIELIKEKLKKNAFLRDLSEMSVPEFVQALKPQSLLNAHEIMTLVREYAENDFESPANWCREQPGLFRPDLSGDNRPVSIPPELRTDTTLGVYRTCKPNEVMNTTRFTVANYGQAFFDEYYRDVPGVNIPIPIKVDLTLIDPSQALYRFSSSKFFPINDKGYVRELLDSSRLLNNQINLDSNYWFTTEIKIPFFYKGNEVFRFKGDDDLWVFIDGKLTTCDLGGIHAAMECSIDLQRLNLKLNTIHQMVIFHAERHFMGSTFEVTTSIVPVNQAPVANNLTVNINENSLAEFRLDGFDPDNNPDLQVKILGPPSLGTLNAGINVWVPLETMISYNPPNYFNGHVSFPFMITDNMNISNIAYAHITVNPINTPPVPINTNLTLKVNETKSTKLQADDVDTPQEDLRFYLASTPRLGYAFVENTTGLLTYQAFKAGVETILWQVGDGSGLYTGKVQVTVLSDAAVGGNTGGPKISQMNLIWAIVGAFALFAILSVAFSYVLYTQCMAKKFQRTWEKEFYQSQMQQNPLYKSAVRESSNPLYNSKDSLRNQV